ncbi:MFS transporter [Pseudomonas sp. Mn2068]|uniref:MFS transporter n=1 Tax=Pseudomonas sp. Mn2068 TaxID=3395265 RepID=UPI003BBD9938
MQGSAPTSALQSRHYKRSCILLVTCISLISFFPLNVLLPAFPALAEQFNTSTVDIALAISLFTLVFAFSQLVAGPLSDRFGRKEVLLGCLAISFVGALGCTLATDFTAFLFFRGVQALGCGFFVLGLALVEDLFDKEERAPVRIYYMSFSGLFVALSPLLGSWLLESFGWRSSFHAFALIAAAIFLLALGVLTSRPKAQPREQEPIMNSIQAILGHADFRRYWQIAALVFSAYFALISVSPLIFMDQLKLSEYQYAIVLLVYGAAYLSGGFLAVWLQRRLGVRAQIDTGHRHRPGGLQRRRPAEQCPSQPLSPRCTQAAAGIHSRVLNPGFTPLSARPIPSTRQRCRIALFIASHPPAGL